MTAAPSRGNPSADDGAGQLLLGVDGGGTKTVAWLATAEGNGFQVVGRGQAGSSNLSAIDQTLACTNLGQAVRRAFDQAEMKPRPAAAAVLALAGSSNPRVQQIIGGWNEGKQFARQLQIVHDARPVVAAGTDDDWGVALIAGTGASAYAVAPDRKQVAATGGWGYLFGDQGSGYWIGREALRCVSQSADGLLPATSLTDALLGAVGATEPRGLLPALKGQGDLRQAVAALAPQAMACAEQGDAAAKSIVEAAAQELARLVGAVAKKIGFRRDYPLAVAGGVLVGSRMLRALLAERLEDMPPASMQVVPEPVAGCVRLALVDLK